MRELHGEGAGEAGSRRGARRERAWREVDALKRDMGNAGTPGTTVGPVFGVSLGQAFLLSVCPERVFVLHSPEKEALSWKPALI